MPDINKNVNVKVQWDNKQADRAVKNFGKNIENTKKQSKGFFKTFRENWIGVTAIVTGVIFAIKGVINKMQDFVATAERKKQAINKLRAVSQNLGLDFKEVERATKSLTKDGLLGLADASQAVSNLMATGLSLDKTIELLRVAKDNAITNRQAHLTLSEAVVKFTEGIRNENSMLTDSVGITKNYSAILKDETKLLGLNANELTKQQKAQIIANGFIKEGSAFIGQASKQVNEYTGQSAKLANTTERLKASIGERLIPAFKVLIALLNPILENLTDWFSTSVDLEGITDDLIDIQDEYNSVIKNLADNQKNLTDQEKLSLEVRKAQLKLDLLDQLEKLNKANIKLQNTNRGGIALDNDRAQILRLLNNEGEKALKVLTDTDLRVVGLKRNNIDFNKVRKDFAEITAKASEQTAKYNLKLASERAGVAKLAEAIKKGIFDKSILSSLTDDLRKKTEAYLVKLEKEVQVTKDITTETGDQAEAVKRLTEEQQKLIDALKDDDSQRIENRIKAYEKLLQLVKGNAEEEALVQRKLTELYKEQEESRRKGKKKTADETVSLFRKIFGEQEKEAEKSGSAIVSMFNDIAGAVVNLGDAVGDKVGGLISSITSDVMSAVKVVEAFAKSTAQGIVALTVVAINKIAEVIRFNKDILKKQQEIDLERLKSVEFEKLNITIARLEKEKELELKAFDEKADLRLKDLIENHEYTKLLEQEELTRYNSLSDDEKKKYDLRVQYEKDLLKEQQRIEAQRNYIEAQKNKKITLAKKKQFEIERQIRIAEIEISRANAIAGVKEKWWSDKDDKLRNRINQTYDELKDLVNSQSFPGAQHGRNVTEGRAYRVGEAGEEVFVPGVSGQIIPHNKVLDSFPALRGIDAFRNQGTAITNSTTNNNDQSRKVSFAGANITIVSDNIDNIVEQLENYAEDRGSFFMPR